MWSKVRDDFRDDPRVIEAGTGAAFLYIVGLTYCARHLTDGRIPAKAVPTLWDFSDIGENALDLAARLVDLGFWAKTVEGFEVVDSGRDQWLREEYEVRGSVGRGGGLAKAKAFATAKALAVPVPVPVETTTTACRRRSISQGWEGIGQDSPLATIRAAYEAAANAYPSRPAP